jgi:hypothetical protein
MSSSDESAIPTKIERAVLYAEVWRTPLRTLAKKYGVSDVALGKICAKLEVPRPGVGHWVRIEHGARIEPTPLPSVSTGQPSVVMLSAHRALQAKTAVGDSAAPRETPPIVEVPETLAGAHSVALELKRALAARTPDKSNGGIVVIKGGPPSPVRVTRKCESRLLRVASALFKGLEMRGHRVALERAPYKLTVVVRIAEIRLAVGFHEHLNQTPHVLTAEEKRSGSFLAPKFDFHGSGTIQIVVGESWQRHVGSWRERAPKTIEKQLGAIVLRIERVAATLRARDRANEEWRQRLAVADDQRKFAELRSQHLRLVEQDLERMSEQSERAARIRSFVAAAREVLCVVPDSEPSAYLAWASAYADEIDPLRHPEKIVKKLMPPDRQSG